MDGLLPQRVSHSKLVWIRWTPIILPWPANVMLNDIKQAEDARLWYDHIAKQIIGKPCLPPLLKWIKSDAVFLWLKNNRCTRHTERNFISQQSNHWPPTRLAEHNQHLLHSIVETFFSHSNELHSGGRTYLRKTKIAWRPRDTLIP